MTRIEQKMAAIEEKLKHVGEPDGLIIYKRGEDPDELIRQSSFCLRKKAMKRNKRRVSRDMEI